MTVILAPEEGGDLSFFWQQKRIPAPMSIPRNHTTRQAIVIVLVTPRLPFSWVTGLSSYWSVKHWT